MGEEWTCTSIRSYCVYIDGRKRLVICPSYVYPLGNIFCYRLNSRYGGPQGRSRHHGEETISSPAGNRIPFPSRYVGHNDIKLSALLFRVGKCRYLMYCWSQWPRGILAAGLLGLWFRIPPEVWKSVSRDCCVLTGRGPSVGLITRPENSYWVLCIKWVWSRSPVIGCNDPESGRSTTKKNSGRRLYTRIRMRFYEPFARSVHCIFLLRKYQKF